MKDTILYERLGLSSTLSYDELRREGKKLLLKYHPDKNENKEESSKKFIETKEILDILCDPKTRKLYHEIGVVILNNNNNNNNNDNDNNPNNDNPNNDNNPNKNSYNFFNEFDGFNNLFNNFTKMMENRNKMKSYQKNFDKDINYIVKVKLSIVDPYIPVVLNIVYRRYNDAIFSEEDKKIIITITAEKLIDIIDKSQQIVMEEQGNILKNKRTNLIINIEEMEEMEEMEEIEDYI